MRRANNVVNEIEMKRRCQCRTPPNSALASELAMKNKWENCENRAEPEVPKNRNAGLFFFEMSKVPGVFEQDAGSERDAGEQIERKYFGKTQQHRHQEKRNPEDRRRICQG